MIRHLTLALACLAFATAAHAGAKEDLHAAFTKFLAQTAFKGSVTSQMAGRTFHSTVEFQAPDRYRVASEGRPPGLIIGNSMYMDIGGRYMKVPALATVAQYRDPGMLTQVERSLSAEDLGMDSIGGAPAHKYRYQVSGAHPSTVTIWVSVASGLPVQLQNSGKAMGKTLDSTISYSNYGDPTIRIDAPK